MAQAAKAQEPSMEEILASIRRIIADDDAAKAWPAELAPAPPLGKPAPPLGKPAPPLGKPAPPPSKPAPPPPPPQTSAQDDIDAMFAAADAAREPALGAAPTADILNLTEAMEAPPQPALQRIDATPDVVYAHEPQAQESPTVGQARRQFKETTCTDRSLLSPATTAAVGSAFNSLAHTVLVQNARTLDDLVREMLCPMLKAWLDDNLPSLVERLVRAEIERVSRGRS